MYPILKHEAVAEEFSTSESKNERRVKTRAIDMQSGTTGITALNEHSRTERALKNSVAHERAIF
jgi:hypothetical protein